MDEGLRERLLDEQEQLDTGRECPTVSDGVDTPAEWEDGCDIAGDKRTTTPGGESELENLANTRSNSATGLWQRLLAIFFIAIAVTTWVTEIEVTKNALGPGEGQYNNYYAVVWVAHGFSGLVGFSVVAILGCFLPFEEGKPSAYSMVFRPSRAMLWQTLVLATLVNTSGWLWFISIVMTDDVVNTVIFQSCCVWCFVISVIVLNEKVTVIKVTATLATFAGVAVISNWPCMSPADEGHVPEGREALVGDTLCLCAAILYALYEVLYKLFAEEEEAAEAGAEEGGNASPSQGSSSLRNACLSATFVGYIGLWDVLVLWVPIAAGHFSGHVPFELPQEGVMPAIIIDCALEGAYLAWIILAISLSSPLFVTIGTVLSIPASALMDYILHGITCPALSFVGTGMVVVGFVGVNVAMLVEGRRGWPAWL